MSEFIGSVLPAVSLSPYGEALLQPSLPKSVCLSHGHLFDPPCSRDSTTPWPMPPHPQGGCPATTSTIYVAGAPDVVSLRHKYRFGFPFQPPLASIRSTFTEFEAWRRVGAGRNLDQGQGRPIIGTKSGNIAGMVGAVPSRVGVVPSMVTELLEQFGLHKWIRFSLHNWMRAKRVRSIFSNRSNPSQPLQYPL